MNIRDTKLYKIIKEEVELYFESTAVEDKDVKFYRRLINSVLNNSSYFKNKNGMDMFEYAKNKDEINNYLVTEFQKYNFDEEVYAPLVAIIEKVFNLIEQKKINIQKVKNFNDIAFLRVWDKIAKKMKEIEESKKTGNSSKFIEKNKTKKLLQ